MPVETEPRTRIRVSGIPIGEFANITASMTGCQTTEPNEYTFTSMTGHQKRIKVLFDATAIMPSNIQIVYEDEDDCGNWYGPLVKYAINGRTELCVVKHDVADEKLRSFLGKVVSVEEEIG